MTSEAGKRTDGGEPGAREQLHPIDYLIVLLKWKKLLAAITAGAAIVSLAVALLLPKIYRAETRILPSGQSSSTLATQFLGQLDSLGIAGGSLGVKNINDLYIGLLQSRVLLDRVIDRFDLMKVYGEKYREDARRKLLESLTLQNDRKSGLITIAVDDRQPKRAAEMANAFAGELKSLTRTIALTEAAQRRLFYEEQLAHAKESLVQSEEAMRGYQEKTGAIEIKEQTKAAIESSSLLRAQIAAKEVQLKVLRTHATPQNPDIQRTVEELQGMKEQLAKLERGSGGGAQLSTGSVPAAGTGYVRKMRDMKYSEYLFEVLAKQYEAAKMDEARDAAVIQIVDQAAVPEKKVKPKRGLLVIFSTISGFLLGIVAVFVLEYARRTGSDPALEEKVATLSSLARFTP